ncbi:MAG: hypothetical protein U9Q03_00390 [Patescibacteria group bacterium]|nr:hypothetical protein [Patescibacteria group bacterium]
MFKKNKKYGDCVTLTKHALLHALGVFLYTAAVSWLLMHGERLFGTGQHLMQPVAVLMLLVLSVALVGTLIFGYPVWLYLESKKKESVKMLVATLVFLFLLTAVALVINVIV